MHYFFKQQHKRSNPRVKIPNRLGSTAVEFSIVCPVVLMIIFGLFEMSRAMTISDSVRTAAIAGAREASIALTTAEEVEAEMRALLRLFRVYNPTIVVTPAVIDAGVNEVTISVEVPMDESNGVVLHRVIGAEPMKLTRVLQR